MRSLAERIAKEINQKVYRGVQMFDCRNTAGDSMETIWETSGRTARTYGNISVEYCRYWDYVEVLGLDDKTYQEVYRLTH